MPKPLRGGKREQVDVREKSAIGWEVSKLLAPAVLPDQQTVLRPLAR